MGHRRRVSTTRPRRIPAWQTHMQALALSPVLWHRPEMMEALRQQRQQRAQRAARRPQRA